MSEHSVHAATSSSLAAALSAIVQPQQTAASTAIGADFAVDPTGGSGTGGTATGSSASAAATPSQISSTTLSALTQLQAASGLTAANAADESGDDDDDQSSTSPSSSSLDPANNASLTQAQYAMQMSQLMQQDLTA